MKTIRFRNKLTQNKEYFYMVLNKIKFVALLQIVFSYFNYIDGNLFLSRTHWSTMIQIFLGKDHVVSMNLTIENLDCFPLFSYPKFLAGNSIKRIVCINLNL